MSYLARFLLTAVGGICVMLGFIGLLVPLMPGFFFFALAVICLSSASPRLHKKMLSYPGVGTFLREIEAARHLELRARIVATLGSAAQLLGGTNRER